MTITPVDWPDVLKPVDFGYSLIDADVSGGQAIGGGEQFIASAGPRWEASMTLDIRTTEQVLALRALRVQLMGRVTPVRLPNFDGRRLSWPPQLTIDGDPTGVILHPGNTRNKMLDDTAYEDDPVPASSEINATLIVPAVLRDTSIQVTVTQGGPLIAGQQFGIGNYLYEIGTVTVDAEFGGITNYTLTFLPPIREAADASDEVLFTRPYSLMRLLNLAEEFRKLQTLRYADLNLEFCEYV